GSDRCVPTECSNCPSDEKQRKGGLPWSGETNSIRAKLFPRCEPQADQYCCRREQEESTVREDATHWTLRGRLSLEPHVLSIEREDVIDLDGKSPGKALPDASPSVPREETRGGWTIFGRNPMDESRVEMTPHREALLPTI